MEDALKERVVGQDHVVAAVSDAVRISRAGLQAPNRPVASFLFMGPTGVGKVSLFIKRKRILFILSHHLDGVMQGFSCIFI
jgi:ATP-dependent Clp protease ATP-binding subunit ClpA